MKVLVCGGRNYSDETFAYALLDLVHERVTITTLIHGAAEGADSIADAWAKSRGIDRLPFPADWELYQKRAGPVRNRKMLREAKPDLVIAFPGGKGTADMLSISRAAGVMCLEV